LTFLTGTSTSCRAAGLTGVVRASLVHYNTAGEVDRLSACLERMGDW